MRDHFRGYYRPTVAEFDELWDVGLIVPDANVLLNFHRLSETPRSSFVALFHALQDRLWIPDQVGREYQRNRLEVVWQQRLIFDDLQNEIDTFQRRIQSTANSQRYHTVLNRDELSNRVQKSLKPLAKYITAMRNAHDSNFPPDMGDDPIHQLVTEIFDSRVGKPYEADRLLQVLSIGKQRYENKTPPGYAEDKSKETEASRLYGDFILWFQLLEHAEANGRNVLLITDDSKEDWWWIERGRTLGPRPELVQEFYERTGKLYYQYNSSRFLQEAISRTLVGETTEEALQEVRELPTYRTPATVTLNFDTSMDAYSHPGFSYSPRTDDAEPFTVTFDSQGGIAGMGSLAPATPSVRGGFVAVSTSERDGAIRLDLLTLPTQVRKVSAQQLILRCQVTDPIGRRFTRDVGVGQILPVPAATLRWPVDFASGDLLTGSHRCLWLGDVDGTGEDRILGGVVFEYPAL